MCHESSCGQVDCFNLQTSNIMLLCSRDYVDTVLLRNEIQSGHTKGPKQWSFCSFKGEILTMQLTVNGSMWRLSFCSVHIKSRDCKADWLEHCWWTYVTFEQHCSFSGFIIYKIYIIYGFNYCCCYFLLLPLSVVAAAILSFCLTGLFFRRSLQVGPGLPEKKLKGLLMWDFLQDRMHFLSTNVKSMVKIHKLKMLQVQIWWQDCYYWQVPHIQQFNFWTNECE